MKTNIGLAEFAASKLGVPYVYGMKGKVMTEDQYKLLKRLYPTIVRDSDIKKVGQVCTDCSGLISWYTGNIKSSSMYHDEAEKSADGVHAIKTVASAPVGAAVWRKGHIGVYIGNGYAIEARGSAYGVVKTKVASRDWTHWFLLKDITYIISAPKTFTKYTGNSSSIVDALNSIGSESSFAFRKKIASANGITLYVGTAAQNKKMLSLLKEGNLVKP